MGFGLQKSEGTCLQPGRERGDGLLLSFRAVHPSPAPQSPEEISDPPDLPLNPEAAQAEWKSPFLQVKKAVEQCERLSRENEGQGGVSGCCCCCLRLMLCLSVTFSELTKTTIFTFAFDGGYGLGFTPVSHPSAGYCSNLGK